MAGSSHAYPRRLVSVVDVSGVVEKSSRHLIVDFALTRRAMLLAIGSLVLAGCFSLLLIVGRTPPFSNWFTDPQFFKRCLVLHVDLALIVWFFSFAAALFSLLPSNASGNRTFAGGLCCACAGVVAMILGTMQRGSAPVLANYVPVIDNALYVGGVALFFGGLLACFVNERLFVQKKEALDQCKGLSWGSFEVRPDAAVALKTTAIAYVVAVTTFLISWAATPRDLESRIYYELVFWGGGHVLQVANVAAMLAVWLILLSSVLNAPVVKRRTAQILFGFLILPHLAAPALVWNGTVASLYRIGFTRLMQWGIAPVVLVFLGICLKRLTEARRAGSLPGGCKDLRIVGFAASAALTLTGFLMGASIRNSNTMIPAHYHASIGAVTVAFMAITYLLLKPVGLPLPSARLEKFIPWQLSLFGFGQVIFAVGFALGGMHGLGRKTYAAEQHVRTAGELAGLLVMGAGGVIAVVGGLLFLFLAIYAGQDRLRVSLRKMRWQIFFRSNA